MKQDDQRAVLSVALGHTSTISFFRHPWYHWCDAFLYAIFITILFETKHGVQKSIEHIAMLTPRAMPLLPLDMMLLQARVDASHLRAFLNVLLGYRFCYSRSLALCAGLRRLGYPCHCVVGYELVYQYTDTPMHAYVEWQQQPISDPYDVQYAYEPVLLYGDREIA